MQSYLIRHKPTGTYISRKGGIFDPQGSTTTDPFSAIRGAKNMLNRIASHPQGYFIFGDKQIPATELEIVNVDVQYNVGNPIA